MPEIATDPKYSTAAAYYANKAELTHVFDSVFAQHPVDWWDKVLEEHDLPHEVLRHFKDIPNDPQAIANHYVHNYEYSDGTKTVFINGPVHFVPSIPSSSAIVSPDPLAGILPKCWRSWDIARRKSQRCMRRKKSVN